MLALFRIATCFCLTVFFVSGAATAQSAAIAGRSTLPDLGRLTHSSGYIFSGTVMSVGRSVTVKPGQLATMEITFRVEEAIRGVRTGQVFAIREWAGLWDMGQGYRPGERVMLFLYPASHLGLTSPVGGSLGRFSLDRNGQIVLPSDKISGAWPAATTLPARPSSGTVISTRAFIRAIQQAGRK